jgi:2-isopropylmalate synthase
MQESELIHDWNRGSFDWARTTAELNDETLRDGLQSPSAIDPPIEVKIQLLHLMADIGVGAANIGLPGAGPRVVESTRALAREIVTQRLPLSANCAARTLVADVKPVVEISHETGLAIEACTFIGSSPIRRYAEGWSLDKMLRVSEEAVTFAVREGLPVMFVTEDTTRADPETLKALYGNAIRWGARRVCLADTVGHATPEGVRRLVTFVRDEIIRPSGESVKIDWHGHRDRGLGIANCLAAIEAGADRIHGSALGLGERVGNAEIDLLIVNLFLLGVRRGNPARLREYCEVAARLVAWSVPPNYPVMGRDAFRTGTGVHAAAIIKAREKGDDWLADRVYSSVPAATFGARQVIEISPMSGISNVRWWLAEHGYDPEHPAACERLFQAAKAADRVLTDDECHALAGQAGARAGVRGG